MYATIVQINVILETKQVLHDGEIQDLTNSISSQFFLIVLMQSGSKVTSFALMSHMNLFNVTFMFNW